MDFFLGVCPGDQWQVGHFGISDRNHKYYVLCFIIAKSENHEAAGKLVDRACELASIDKVLVDGGKALSKAIGIKDQSNIAQLKKSLPKEAHPIIDRELNNKQGTGSDSLHLEVDTKGPTPEATEATSLLSQVYDCPVHDCPVYEPSEETSILCPADAPPSSGEAELASSLRPVPVPPSLASLSGSADAPFGSAEAPSPSGQATSADPSCVLGNHSEDMDTLFQEVVEIIGQTNDEAGDLMDRASLEDRMKVLLRKHRLLLERCHAHITRNAGNRGGGWRGGKGSLCRALLNNGCKQEMMRSVRDNDFCMTVFRHLSLTSSIRFLAMSSC